MNGTKNFFDLSKKEQVNLIAKNWDSEAIIEKRVMFEKIHWDDAEEVFFGKLNANGIDGVTFVPSIDFYQDEDSSPYIDEEAYIDIKTIKDNKGFIFTVDVPNLDELKGDVSVEGLVDTCLAIYKTKNQDEDEEDINNLDEEDYKNILKEMDKYLPTVREAISFLDKEINETLDDLSTLKKYDSFSEENAQLIIEDFILNKDEVEVTEDNKLIINGTLSKMVTDEDY